VHYITQTVIPGYRVQHSNMSEKFTFEQHTKMTEIKYLDVKICRQCFSAAVCFSTVNSFLLLHVFNVICDPCQVWESSIRC